MLRKHPDLSFCLLLSLFVLFYTLPFLNHAYHIDEPLFLRIAEQIKEHFLDPYGFNYVWHIELEPVHQIAGFPPLFAYYLALIGWNFVYPPEWLIHLSLIPFSILGVISFYFLARQFDFSALNSFIAAALFALCPAYAVSANMAMPDVAMTSFSLSALVLAIRGWRKSLICQSFPHSPSPLMGEGRGEGDSGYKREGIYELILSGVLLGCATLLRYNAVPMILILFLFGLTYPSPLPPPQKGGGRVLRASLPSLIALGMFFLWIFFSQQMYHSSHTSEVLSTFGNANELIRHFWAFNNHLTLSTLLPLFVLLLVKKNRFFWTLLITFLSLDFALYAAQSQQVIHFAMWPDVIFFGLGLSTLIYLGAIFYREWKQNKFWSFHSVGAIRAAPASGMESPLQKTFSLTFEPLTLERKKYLRWMILFLWFISIIAIPLFYVMFASKYLLLALPPLILILLAELQKLAKNYLKLCFALLPVLLILSLSLAHADFLYAKLYRDQAEKFSKTKRNPNSELWFVGHWGFQYYMEKVGGLPLAYHYSEENAPEVGDLVVESSEASPQPILSSLEKNLFLIDQSPSSISSHLKIINHDFFTTYLVVE